MKLIQDQVIYLSTKMPYGKYKGMTFYEIIKKDITYVNWFRRTINKNWDAKLKDMFDMYWEYYHR